MKTRTQNASARGFFADAAVRAAKGAVRLLLRFDRNVVKRHTGLETPLYKLWWQNHSKNIQNRLDKRHKEIRRAKYA